jgi:hypothetical protein
MTLTSIPASTVPAVAETFAGPREPNERERELYRRLLSHGGDRVVVPADEEDPDLERVFARGQLLDGASAILKPGVPRRCHQNAARLWERGQTTAKIRPVRGCTLATGYALSDDGLWRSHSFCVAADGRVLETTTLRDRYFGVLLDSDEAAAFFSQELTGSPPAALQALIASFAAGRPRIGCNRRALSSLREAQVASGLCVSVARAFASHCANANVTARATGWLSTRSLGLGTDGERNHSVCLVSLDGRSWWTVDWSAAQYGSNEFPRIRVAAPHLTPASV